MATQDYQDPMDFLETKDPREERVDRDHAELLDHQDHQLRLAELEWLMTKKVQVVQVLVIRFQALLDRLVDMVEGDGLVNRDPQEILVYKVHQVLKDIPEAWDHLANLVILEKMDCRESLVYKVRKVRLALWDLLDHLVSMVMLEMRGPLVIQEPLVLKVQLVHQA